MILRPILGFAAVAPPGQFVAYKRGDFFVSLHPGALISLAYSLALLAGAIGQRFFGNASILSAVTGEWGIGFSILAALCSVSAVLHLFCVVFGNPGQGETVNGARFAIVELTVAIVMAAAVALMPGRSAGASDTGLDRHTTTESAAN